MFEWVLNVPLLSHVFSYDHVNNDNYFLKTSQVLSSKSSISSSDSILMKACHEDKAKTLLLGVRKILLAAYALVRKIY